MDMCPVDLLYDIIHKIMILWKDCMIKRVHDIKKRFQVIIYDENFSWHKKFHFLWYHDIFHDIVKSGLNV